MSWILPLGFIAWATLVAWAFLAGTAEYWLVTVPFWKTVGWAGLSTYSAWILGWAVLRSTMGPREPSSALRCAALEIGTGLGLVMAAMFLGGVAGLYARPFALVLVLAPLVLRHDIFWRELRSRRSARSWSAGPSWLALVAIGAMTLAESLAPAISQDALVYHLAVPAKFIEAGRLSFVEGNFYSAFPMNTEMLFTLGLLLDGETLAKFYHWLFGALSAAAIAGLVGRCRASEANRPTAAFAAALFVSVPTVALISSWAYVDLAVVFYVVLSVDIALEWMARQGADGACGRPSSLRHLGLSAWFAGLAAGAKYTAGWQGVLLFALASRASWRMRTWSPAVLVAAVLAVTAGPWFIKNFVLTGNPLYPFAYSLFGGTGWSAERAEVLRLSLAEWGGGGGPLAWLTLPWDVTVHGRFFSQEGFDGVIGFAFLAGLPLIAREGMTHRVGRTIGFFALGHAALWVATTHQVRFLLPALALACPLLAVGISRLEPTGLRHFARGLAGLAVGGGVLLVAIRAAHFHPLGVALGLESKDEYMERALPGGDWAVFRYIDEELPPDARILFGSCGGPGFLCRRPYVSEAYFENAALLRYLDPATGADDLRDRLRADGLTHIIFRFDTVFDPSRRRSEVAVDRQELFAEFLNRHARLVRRADATLLYELNPVDAATDGGSG